MRIVIATPCIGEVFGQERVIRDSTALLRNAGHSVYFLADKQHGEAPPNDGMRVIDGISTLHQLSFPSKVSLLHAQAFNFIASVKPDLIHFIDQFDFRFMRRLAAQYPVVYSAHSVGPTCPASGRLIPSADAGGPRVCEAVSGWACLGHDKNFGCLGHLKGRLRKSHSVHNYLLRRSAVKQGAGMIAVSKYIERQLIADGWEPSKIRLVYNPVFVPSRVEPYRDAPPVLLTVAARLHPLKGIDYLLKALKPLAGLNWNLWICGEGSERQSLEKLTHALELHHKVKFLGQTSYELTRQIFAASKIVIQPNLGPEAFGLSVAEASGIGVPIVAYDLPALNEIVKHQRTGWLVERASISGMTKAVAELLQNEVLRRRLGSQGPDWIRSQFSPESHLQATLDAYRAYTGGRLPTSPLEKRTPLIHFGK